MLEPNEKAVEMRARRAAKRVGLLAKKSRWRRHPRSVDNYGQFMLVNPYRNAVEAGLRFDLSAEQVIEYCSRD
jgi:hypothetical protein